MFTVKAQMSKETGSYILRQAKDWDDAVVKATVMRKEGLLPEIWNQDGVRVYENDSGEEAESRGASTN